MNNINSYVANSILGGMKDYKEPSKSELDAMRARLKAEADEIRRDHPAYTVTGESDKRTNTGMYGYPMRPFPRIILGDDISKAEHDILEFFVYIGSVIAETGQRNRPSFRANLMDEAHFGKDRKLREKVHDIYFKIRDWCVKYGKNLNEYEWAAIDPELIKKYGSQEEIDRTFPQRIIKQAQDQKEWEDKNRDRYPWLNDEYHTGRK